jgi:hypothetical protein
MEKYCVNLEIAKQLKDADWKKETEYWWIKSSVENEGFLFVNHKEFLEFMKWHGKIRDKNKWFSAPLSDEILEELPLGFVIERFKNKKGIEYSCWWYEKGEERNRKGTIASDNFLPNALAKMYCYLRKKGLI